MWRMDTTHPKTMGKFLMAYIRKDGSGPYPNKAGEYCGNHHPTLKPFCFDGKRYGRPRPCANKISEEMAAAGWVGLYWEEDSTPWSPDDCVEIPTPPELMEPRVLNPRCELCKGTGRVVLFTSSCECDCVRI